MSQHAVSIMDIVLVFVDNQDEAIQSPIVLAVDGDKFHIDFI